MSNGNAPIHRGVKIIAAVCLLAYLSGGAWFYRSHEESLRREAEDRLASIAALKADQIAQWRAERLGAATILEHGSLTLRRSAAAMKPSHSSGLAKARQAPCPQFNDQRWGGAR